MNHAERYLIWFVSAALATAAIAWIAFQIQSDGFAPAVLFPLLVGSALGGTLVAIGRLTRWPGPRAAVVGAVCWGLLAVVAQDYIGHRYALREYNEKLNQANPLAVAVAREGEMLPTLSGHLARTWQGHPVWWTLDLALTAAAAGIATAFGLRTKP